MSLAINFNFPCLIYILSRRSREELKAKAECEDYHKINHSLRCIVTAFQDDCAGAAELNDFLCVSWHSPNLNLRTLKRSFDSHSWFRLKSLGWQCWESRMSQQSIPSRNQSRLYQLLLSTLPFNLCVFWIWGTIQKCESLRQTLCAVAAAAISLDSLVFTSLSLHSIHESYVILVSWVARFFKKPLSFLRKY